MKRQLIILFMSCDRCLLFTLYRVFPLVSKLCSYIPASGERGTKLRHAPCTNESGSNVKLSTAHHQYRDKERKEYLHRQVA